MWKYFEEGKPAIDLVIEEINRQEEKSVCLEIYREQLPDIKLYNGVISLISKIKSKGIKIGIITDGRVSGQIKKIRALGLEDFIDDIIITDELGGIQFRKPNDISFRIMQCRWGIPFEEIVYIGDNINKDFVAPLQLGMKSILIKNMEGIYYTDEGVQDKQINTIQDIIMLEKLIL